MLLANVISFTSEELKRERVVTLQYPGHSTGAYQFCDEGVIDLELRDEKMLRTWGASRCSCRSAKAVPRFLALKNLAFLFWESSVPFGRITLCARVDTKAALFAALGAFTLN